ncbi:nucleotidyltransferase family protein [Porticoccaceae bacterium]|jgi:N-acetyl-alpha-D-muramate 1-phosphate uridylyltransferase|nr:nucleotidyltransferase family protein [Porticoccaceae bacterium]
MKAMILAAGYGKRLQPLTNKTPKPLLAVAGKPLLQHHIERLAAIGITDLVINTSWLAEQIETYFGDGSCFGVNITWSREPQPLETGGGLNKALPYLGDQPFLLINGDVWTDFSFLSALNYQLHADHCAWLLLVENPTHNLDGDFALSDSLVSYQSQKKFTFSGISILRPQLIRDYVKRHSVDECFPLRDILRPAIEQQTVVGALHTGQWCDVGTVSRYEELNQRLGSQHKP